MKKVTIKSFGTKILPVTMLLVRLGDEFSSLGYFMGKKTFFIQLTGLQDVMLTFQNLFCPSMDHT